MPDSTPRRARIVGSRALSPSVRSLSLAFEGGPLEFVAGQWLHIHVPTETGLARRAYSIASRPGAHELELAITHVPSGSASPVLHALSVGSELMCDGPHGFFTRAGEERSAPALFVGTGTGLSPLRSMLAELLEEPSHPPVTLLFGVRSQHDILWREELERWCERDPRFRLEVTLSRPQPGWSGRVGYVQAHLAELVSALESPHVYICGLSPMVSAVRALCRGELGLDRRRVHSERYD